MVISHNMSAINTNRQFGIVNVNQAKSTEKLSSGYRINRAADDAAGLAISEKMRRQIRGLTQASVNCQDGISLVQVADGGLSEMTDIMQRMNELSVKAANGTMQVDDREAIQTEINALKSELRRIQDSTTFNEIYLFKGNRAIEMDAADYSRVPFDEIGTVEGKTVKYSKTMDLGNIGDSEEDREKLAGKSFQVTCSQSCSQVFTFSFDHGGSSGATFDGTNLSVYINLDEYTDGKSIAQAVYDWAATESNNIAHGGNFPVNIGHANGLDVQGSKLIFFGNTDDPNGTIRASQFDEPERELIIQAGSESSDDNTIKIKLFNVGPSLLGVSGVDVTSQAGAQTAIDQVKGGIIKLNTYRSYYGAMQNRLEHTIKNLDNVVENTSAAESRIRDTDMATEMVRYSNNNILLQAGTAMMAQANQSNQNVLSLLQ